MTINIYGKINCYTNVTSSSSGTSENKAINEVYVQAYKFMQYLETQGVVELYTMFTGAGIFSASWGVGYWDEPEGFGSCPFSVWKWKTNINRNWEWYLLLQTNYGFASHTDLSQLLSQALPTSTSYSPGTGQRYLMAAAAFTMDGTNPWNGLVEINNGQGAKRIPVWKTNSFVFPRANNSDGSNSTNKELTSILTEWYEPVIEVNTKSLTHFFSDGNGFAMIQQGAKGNPATLANNYNVYYFGPYGILKAISQSNPGKVLGNENGFLHFTSKIANNESDLTTYPTLTLPNGPDGHIFGPKSINANILDGGVFATSDIGVRQGQISYENYNDSSRSPNKLINKTASIYMERPIMVISTEDTQTSGIAGWLNTPLIRSIVGVQSHDIRSDGMRVVFGANGIATDKKITTPWSGSVPNTGSGRDGTNFTWTNYDL